MWKFLMIVIIFSFVAVCSATADGYNIWINGTKCERKMKGICISKKVMNTVGCPFDDPRTTLRGCPKSHTCCVPHEKVTARKVIPGICGKPPLFKTTSKSRIVGGYGVKDGEIPWQVLLRVQRLFPGFPTPSPFCGGAIIDKKWILTAAHCFGKYSPIGTKEIGRLRVVTGVTKIEDSHLRNGKIQVHHASKVLLHEKYNASNDRNDIALIKLTKPIKFNDYSIPVCLPDKNENFEGIICTVSGWGVINSSTEMSSKYLRALNIPVVRQKMCTKLHHEKDVENEVFKTNLCTMFVEGRRDACDGDSGGPLACRMNSGQYILSGVVSWGDADGCGQKKLPGIYTKVAKYVDWIKKKTGISVPKV